MVGSMWKARIFDRPLRWRPLGAKAVGGAEAVGGTEGPLEVTQAGVGGGSGGGQGGEGDSGDGELEGLHGLVS